MPTYEYRCKACGEHLEVAQSFRDDPLTECPNCSGTLKKVFQPIGIAFKGSGFYRNDSRTSGSKATSSTKAGDASGSNNSDNSDSSNNSGSSNGSGSSSGSSESSGTTKDTATTGNQARSA